MSVEITDRESLRAWLDTQPREVAVAIAARAALRVFSDLVRWVGVDPDANLAIVMPTSRAMTASVAGYAAPDATVRSAAANAANAAYASYADAAADASYAAAHAADAAYAAYAADAAADADASYAAYAADAAADADASYAANAYANAVWKEIQADVAMLSGTNAKSPGDMINVPVWSDDDSAFKAEMDAAWLRLVEILRTRPADEGWEWWIAWYEARRDGLPYHAEKEREIVLIADDVWEAGQAAVWTEIKRIEEKYSPAAFASPVPVAETINGNAAIGISTNPDHDAAAQGIDVEDLIDRQLANLEELSEGVDGSGNASPTLSAALRLYRRELSEKRINAGINLLKDRAERIIAGRGVMDREGLLKLDESLDVSLTGFIDLHGQIVDCFPAERARQAAADTAAGEVSRREPGSVISSLQAFKDTIDGAREDERLTPDAADYLGQTLEDAIDADHEATFEKRHDHPDNVALRRKRLLGQVAGFGTRLVDLLRDGIALSSWVASTDTGKAFYARLIAVLTALGFV